MHPSGFGEAFSHCCACNLAKVAVGQAVSIGFKTNGVGSVSQPFGLLDATRRFAH